jgi:MYXO-CTERM domain-containing protein
MKTFPARLGLALAAALVVLPAPALAKKDNLAERAKDIAEQANDVQAQAGALANDAANADAARDADASARSGDRDSDGNAATDDGDGHDGFPWGLLGLLGLAGLAGLRRNDRDGVRRDPHVYTTGGDSPRV